MAGVLCSLVGVLYPVVASFKAIETRDSSDDTQWLTYWTVYSVVGLFEGLAPFVPRWLPFYYWFKFAWIVYLIAPQTQGAERLYRELIKPWMNTHQGWVEPLFAMTSSSLNSGVANSLAKMVENQGPQAKENLSKLFSNPAAQHQLNNLAKLDPKSMEAALKMATDFASGGGQAAPAPKPRAYGHY